MATARPCVWTRRGHAACKSSPISIRTRRRPPAFGRRSCLAAVSPIGERRPGEPEAPGRSGRHRARVLQDRSVDGGQEPSADRECARRDAGSGGDGDHGEGQRVDRVVQHVGGDIRHIMTRPYTMASSDGGLVLPTEGKPHPRDYGAFARRLAVYVRERAGRQPGVRDQVDDEPAGDGLRPDRSRRDPRRCALPTSPIFDPAKVKDAQPTPIRTAWPRACPT